MPQSHYPSQGGPHRAAWNPSDARKPRRAVGHHPSPAGHATALRQSAPVRASAAPAAGAIGNGTKTALLNECKSVPQAYEALTTWLDTRFAAGFHKNRAVLGAAVLLFLTAAIFAVAAIVGHG